MGTQIPSPDGTILGVIRCIDAVQVPNTVFNCFNHFHLEALQHIARVFGIIYTLKERMRLNHDLILQFVHEFRSSMMGIKGNIDLAEVFLERDDQQAATNKLDDAIMTPMLEDIKNASLTSLNKPIKMSPSDTGWWWLETDFLMPVKNSFQDEAFTERRIGIHYEKTYVHTGADGKPTMQISAFAIRINVDRKLMMQVFSNLVRNAIKYSYDPKSPHVTLSMLKNIEIHFQIGIDGSLTIDFENYGIGIDDDERTVIFEQYRKGRKAGSQSSSGLGLGLFICKEIMERHGGGIFVKSLDDPTTFTIIIPAKRVRHTK